jgi:putative nucleotidyltransferase with HDIG domain
MTPVGSEPSRVLYVDRDATQLVAFERAVRDESLECKTATTGREGLRALDETSFAVLLVDLVLPDMSAMEFLARAARLRPEAVRVLALDRLDPDTIVDAVNKVGVFRILQKPWDGSQLRNAVRRAVVQHRLLADNHLMAVRLQEVNEKLHGLNRELDGRVAERTSQLLLSLCNALDLRDTDTQWHSRRVALYTRRLCAELGLHGEELRDIERGALLHDIGKIGVSDTILLKPGKLTEDEWTSMRRHSLFGAQILAGIPFLLRARQLVAQHHERWDGRGYNSGLRGEQICIGARVFSVIDTYDAITSDRPYRKAMGHAQALLEIRKGRGTQFDPAVVDAFERVRAEDWDEIRRRSADSEAALD